MHYDTVKSTTRVKEENEALLLLLLFERVFIRLGHGSVVEKIEEEEVEKKKKKNRESWRKVAFFFFVCLFLI